MKNFLILFTLIGSITAIPADIHRRHEGHGQTTAVAAQTATAAATGEQADGHKHGHHHHGNKGNPATSTAAASTTAAAAASKSTANPNTGNSVNPPNTGNNGNNANPGNNANTGNNANNNKGGVNPAQVPDFGQQAGLKPDGTGNCKSDAGKTIPCQCPPSRAAFIAKLNEFVSAGSFFGKLAAPFPSGNSNADAIARIDTIISTLQNFNGKPGVGCPSVSAPNFGVVQQKLLKGG